MTERLQKIDFRSSQYDRPQQDWQCGREGSPCLLGPGGSGSCQSCAECLPFKDGDRWKCTRPLHLGGACEPGPSGAGTCHFEADRCRPVRSLRVLRGRAVWSVVLVLLVLTIIAALTPVRAWVFDPGPLMSAHRAKNMSCSTCHAVGTENPLKWVGLAVSSEPTESRNAPCLRCHQFGQNGNHPHGASRSALDARAHKTGGGGEVSATTDVRCASCHREHQGGSLLKDANSISLCNTCHEKRATNFATDHPDFVGFASARRTPLVFDHVKHANDHFQKDEVKAHKPANCQHCHRRNNGPALPVSIGFDAACGNCHSKDVTGERFTEPGLAFISLPAIDVESLKRAGISIGEWPDGLVDEELNPFTLWLLSSDSEIQPLLVRLEKRDTKLNDLENADRETLQQVGKLVWRLKRTLNVLGGAADEPEQRRLLSLLGYADPVVGARELSRRFPSDGFQLVRAWMPNLATEVEQLSNGSRAAPTAMRVVAKATFERRPGTWYRDDSTLFYRPGGHNDSFLRGWYDALAAVTNSQSGAALSAFRYVSDKEQPGQCSRCHSIDQLDGHLTVNWQSRRDAGRGFTRFNHVPHLTVLGDKACSECHVLDEQAKYLASYKEGETNPVASNFRGATKAICVACHDGKKVREDCELCHRYHIGK